MDKHKTPFEYKMKQWGSTYYALRVGVVTSECVNTCFTKESFVRMWAEGVNKIPRKSVGFASNYYRLCLTGVNCFSVWHVNVRGEMDYKCAEIEFKDAICAQCNQELSKHDTWGCPPF